MYLIEHPISRHGSEYALQSMCFVCDNRLLTQNASTWLMEDLYRNPGPIQFEGPGSNLITLTLSAEENDYIGKIQALCAYLEKVKQIVKPGCSREVLNAALISMASVTDILSIMSAPAYRGLAPF
jgi:pyrophosphate--fructose-6-phosphate 1-phosphotransferase